MDRLSLGYGLFLTGIIIFGLSLVNLSVSADDFLSLRIVQMITSKGGVTLFGALYGVIHMLAGIVFFISYILKPGKPKKGEQ